MFQNLINKLARCLVQELIFLEFTKDDVLSEDVSVERLEQISAELQGLNENEKNILISEIRKIATTYNSDLKDFIKMIPNNLGLL